MPSSTKTSPSRLRCSRCRKRKLIAEFSRQTKGRSGRHAYCRPCNRDAQREWREKYPDYYRNQQLLWKYGITYDDYLALLKKQKGKCAICRKRETALIGHGPNKGKVRLLAVDHDHDCCPSSKTCGKCIRGLLCQRCNQALGMVRNDTEVLEAMIEYLSQTAAAITG